MRNQPKALSIFAVMIVCLTVVGAMACQFHPASSEHEHTHEKERPAGQHPEGPSHGVFCLIATLPEDQVLVEFACVSWTAVPLRLHATLVVSPLFIPPRYLA
jgi:hypothetical protein